MKVWRFPPRPSTRANEPMTGERDYLVWSHEHGPWWRDPFRRDPVRAAARWLVRLLRREPELPRGVTAEEWAMAGNPIAGTCPVCSAQGVQFTNSTGNLRESGSCARCGASNRQRQMAFVLRKALRLGSSH